MISYKKLFHGFIWFLFLGFLVLYFARGKYFEDPNKQKTILTQEKIEQFEKDIESGKKIDVKDYVVDLQKDYSNSISNFGLYTSKSFAGLFKKGLNSLFSGINKMVN